MPLSMTRSKGSAVDSSQILNVVLRSLGSIDSRLIEHGERVAFLSHELLRFAGGSLDLDPEILFVLSALHDIGAYKTEEIDNLIHFETSNVRSHAAYGYLFLMNSSRLRDCADAILYHHTSYERFAQISSPYALYAQMIFLADRADILVSAGRDLSALQQDAGTRFNPKLVDLLLRAEAAHGLVAKLVSGDYRRDVDQIIASMRFTSEEVLDFLNLLVFAMDFRSECTVSHTANTTFISMRLAEYMELTEHAQKAIYYGATFHDIGKIAIPVEILEKASRLTEAEMAVMRTHVEQSENILRGVIDDEVCDIAVRHHEKLNGRGYPRGLNAEDLTRPQRIVAVADVLSALSGKRSYKERFSKKETLDILTGMRNRGELCPEVCGVVFTNYDEIMAHIAEVESSMTALYHAMRDKFDATVQHLP